MAAVPASITLTFVSYYAGVHRVCYRTGGTGPYTCNNVSCAGGGASCTYTITVAVDNESCDPVEFDGYVQAACQDIASTTGRVPFAYTFTPSPSCARYEVTCNSVGVLSATINTVGSCYTPGSPPSINFSGGGGSGATALAVIGSGAILSRALINAGAGYNNGTYTNVDLTGGTGSGAKATVVIAGGIAISLVITAAGIGYTTGDVLGVDATDIGGSSPSTPVSFSVTSDYGTLIGISMSSPGTGYTSAPTITVGPTGCGAPAATATAVLGFCSELVNPGCDGLSPVVYPANLLGVGEHVDICSSTIPTAPSDYTVTPNGNCLCDCQTVVITALEGDAPPATPSVNYWFNDCNGNAVTGVLYPNGSPSSVTACIVTGSLVIQENENAIANISYIGECTP